MTRADHDAADQDCEEPVFDFVTAGCRVLVSEMGSQAPFEWFHVRAQDADRLFPAKTVEELRKQLGGLTAEHVCVGADIVGSKDGAPSHSLMTLKGHERLGAFVNDAVQVMAACAQNERSWPSLGAMLETRFEHDPTAEPPSRQPVATCWWATATPLGRRGVVEVAAYADRGLFVDDEGLLRVYTAPSLLDRARGDGPLAGLGADRDLEIDGVRVPCLGCFLKGVSGDAGPERIRGAALDDQWRIDFHTCDSHGHRAASHFTLADGSVKYHLVGCADRGDGPVWAAEKWLGRAFHVRCELRPW